jgi:hypothetical protein
MISAENRDLSHGGTRKVRPPVDSAFRPSSGTAAISPVDRCAFVIRRSASTMLKLLSAAMLALALGACSGANPGPGSSYNGAPPNQAAANALAGVPPVIEIRH